MDFPQDIKFRATAKEKERNKFKRQKELAHYYDLYSGDFRDFDEIDKKKINYDLLNGRLDIKLYDNPIQFNAGGEIVSLDQNEIVHYPFIAQVAAAAIGEEMARPFRPIAVEHGTRAMNLRRKTYNELIRQYLTTNITQPIIERVKSEYFREYQIQDMSMLQPEQQQQVQSEIMGRSQAMTPKEILDFMSNDFQTPTERQHQQLLDFLVKTKNIDRLSIDGFIQAYANGNEYYKIVERNGEPELELVNDLYFQCGGGARDTVWVDEMDWAKEENWMTIQRAISLFGEHFDRKDLKKLESFMEPVGGLPNLRSNISSLDEKVMMILSSDNAIAEKYKNVDVRLNSGQQAMAALYNNLAAKWGNGYSGLNDFGVRHSHVTFRDKRKLYGVKRVIDGKLKTFYVAEHYTPQPEDEKVWELWADEIWECDILGSYDPIYTNIRRVPNVYRSLNNPFDVRLPYVGRKYHTRQNNSKNISFVDMGKPYQKEIDITFAELRHDMATDIGKVLAVVMNMRPDNWKWQDWFTMMKSGRVLPLQTDKHGQGPLDATLIKDIDLSRTSDIAAKLNLIGVLEQKLIQSMSFNPSRLGAISQYSNAQNTQINRAASFNQTEYFFSMHRQVVERALDQLVNRAKFEYRNNPEKLDLIFDDVARADIELTQNFWNTEVGVSTSLKQKDIDAVETMKQNILTLAQNGMGLEAIMELSMAETTSDMMAIFKRERMRSDAMRQQEMEQMQQMEGQKQQVEVQTEEMKQQFKAQENALDREASIARAQIGATQWQLQADVDGNKIADHVETAQMELAAKIAIEEQKLELAKKKLELEEMKIKNMKPR